DRRRPAGVAADRRRRGGARLSELKSPAAERSGAFPLRSGGVDRDDVAALVGLEADRRRPAHAGEEGDVVQLADHALDALPGGHVAGREVEDGKAAARLDVAA